eukprot:COSAG01_NODE_32077_length_586_cov_10.291581_1_plen_30_part_10
MVAQLFQIRGVRLVVCIGHQLVALIEQLLQ